VVVSGGRSRLGFRTVASSCSGANKQTWTASNPIQDDVPKRWASVNCFKLPCAQVRGMINSELSLKHVSKTEDKLHIIAESPLALFSSLRDTQCLSMLYVCMTFFTQPLK
jgi:hypothetical protein